MKPRRIWENGARDDPRRPNSIKRASRIRFKNTQTHTHPHILQVAFWRRLKQIIITCIFNWSLSSSAGPAGVSHTTHNLHHSYLEHRSYSQHCGFFLFTASFLFLFATLFQQLSVCSVQHHSLINPEHFAFSFSWISVSVPISVLFRLLLTAVLLHSSSHTTPASLLLSATHTEPTSWQQPKQSTAAWIMINYGKPTGGETLQHCSK